MTLQGAGNTANLGAGTLSSIAAFQQLRSARRSARAQAKFIEQVAEQEAQAILQAGDERLTAYAARAQQLLEEEAVNRFSGEARAREARDIGEVMIAKIQAKNAAKGISLTEGSPLELAALAAFESEKNAANEELQTRLMSENLLTRAKEEMKAGQGARFAAKMQARATILTAKAQATGIRTQAPSIGDLLSKIAKPLSSLDRDKVEAGIEPVASLLRRKPSSPVSPISPTSETPSEPRIYGNL